MKKPLIIFDTDMDTDCDDAGALGLILEYVRAGWAELLGVIADAPDVWVAGCCDAICRWYGFPRPVGAVYAADYSESPRFSDYRAHRASMTEDRFYNRILAAGKRDTDYPRAAELYRRLLAQAEDESVTVVCVGFLTALAELFATGSDSISPLSGIDLFRQKVRTVVTMGNAQFPVHSGSNFNYKMDTPGAHQVFAQCPVPMSLCPEGTQVITGYSFPRHFTPEHPLRIAYRAFVGQEGVGRSSWDLITALYALEPELECFQRTCHGTVRFALNQSTCWEADGPRQDGLLSLAISNREMAEFLEERLIHGIS